MISTLSEIRDLSSTLFYNSLTCHTGKLIDQVCAGVYQCLTSVDFIARRHRTVVEYESLLVLASFVKDSGN